MAHLKTLCQHFYTKPHSQVFCPCRLELVDVQQSPFGTFHLFSQIWSHAVKKQSNFLNLYAGLKSNIMNKEKMNSCAKNSKSFMKQGGCQFKFQYYEIYWLMLSMGKKIFFTLLVMQSKNPNKTLILTMARQKPQKGRNLSPSFKTQRTRPMEPRRRARAQATTQSTRWKDTRNFGYNVNNGMYPCLSLNLFKALF